MAGTRSITAVGRIDWNEGEIRVLLSGPGGETSEEIQRRARAVQRRAQSKAPMGKTGDLRSSITVNTSHPSQGAVADITAEAYYAGFVEFGRRSIDLSGSGHVLHWESREGGDSFRSKAGAVAATHFMQDSLDAAAG